ncbi:MAG: hypothetical protein EAZ85_05035 [Bacteroidetes bacterium]|nr:MAG: hypothetical protein EAZ85_05035 [Bacteroidota bacterium]TAG85756.1 MAG: hypothetical protein EAZ20_14280 [Bacteroidota bacterium]
MQIFAQKTVTLGKFSKKFDTKYHYLDVPSWNTFGKKDTYIPLFIETYYEVTKTEVIEYALWYSDSKNVYNFKNIDKMAYTEKMLSAVFVTKYPIETLDTDLFLAQKDENNDWVSLYKDDKGAAKIMKKFKKPYHKIPFKLKTGKKYTYTQYNPTGEPEVESRDTDEFTKYFNFNDESEASIFVGNLVKATSK